MCAYGGIVAFAYTQICVSIRTFFFFFFFLVINDNNSKWCWERIVHVYLLWARWVRANCFGVIRAQAKTLQYWIIAISTNRGHALRLIHIGKLWKFYVNMLVYKIIMTEIRKFTFLWILNTSSGVIFSVEGKKWLKSVEIYFIYLFIWNFKFTWRNHCFRKIAF